MIILPKIKNKLFHQQLKNVVNTKTHEERVLFSLNSVKDIVHRNNEKATKDCVELTEKWLKDHGSVAYYDLVDFIGYCDSSYYDNDFHRALRSVIYAIMYPINLNFATNACANISNELKKYYYYMKFYINEAGLILKPHSIKSSPSFNLNNQEEFLIALDFIQEFYHEDLLQTQNDLIFFKFYDFLKANTLPELINDIFKNETYKKQITRIIAKLLEN